MRRIAFGARRAAFLAVVPLTLLGSGALVWHASYSAFTATTSTGTNSWTTGTVDITSDQVAGVQFSVTGIKPDASLSALSPGATGGAYAASSVTSGGSKCVKVTYQGTVASDIRMYITLGGADSATFGAQLLFTVDAVSSAIAADPTCATYPTASTYVYGTSGTTTAFLNGAPTTYAGANATAWQNAANTNAKFYRISWLYPTTVNQTATSTKNVTAIINWEAHSV
jgi:hypothetical protein